MRNKGTFLLMGLVFGLVLVFGITTGAMAGEDSVFDAAFKRAGIIRVDTITALFDCAELMAKQPRPKGPRLGIITNAGGVNPRGDRTASI